MKIGIVVYSNDPETVWNAFRLANTALEGGDAVSVFLLGKGVECESLDTERFEITEQMTKFAERDGRILACGTCLRIRNAKGSELCPASTMKDLHRIIKESDRIVTF